MGRPGKITGRFYPFGLSVVNAARSRMMATFRAVEAYDPARRLDGIVVIACFTARIGGRHHRQPFLRGRRRRAIVGHRCACVHRENDAFDLSTLDK